MTSLRNLTGKQPRVPVTVVNPGIYYLNTRGVGEWKSLDDHEFNIRNGGVNVHARTH